MRRWSKKVSSKARIKPTGEKKRPGAIALGLFVTLVARHVGLENSARARPQRRARRKWPRPQTQSGTYRRRHRLQHASAIGTSLQPCIGAGKMRAQPVATRGALRINALHGPAGQILHGVSLRGCRSRERESPGQPERRRWREFCSQQPVVSRENATRYSGNIAGAVSGRGALSFERPVRPR